MVENTRGKGEIALYDFKFDKKGRKLSKLVENTMGKGEIACYEQFPLFPQCFQNTSITDLKKPGIVWETKLQTPKFLLHILANCIVLITKDV